MIRGCNGCSRRRGRWGLPLVCWPVVGGALATPIQSSTYIVHEFHAHCLSRFFFFFFGNLNDFWKDNVGLAVINSCELLLQIVVQHFSCFKKLHRVPAVFFPCSLER